MEAVAKNAEMRAAHELGDESFMSAADLHAYMAEMEVAKAMKEVDAMDRAEKARKELIKTLSTPASLEEIEEIVASVQHKVRSAAQRGATELMVMRFPCALCADKGRAINNAVRNWLDTEPLTRTASPSTTTMAASASACSSMMTSPGR